MKRYTKHNDIFIKLFLLFYLFIQCNNSINSLNSKHNSDEKNIISHKNGVAYDFGYGLDFDNDTLLKLLPNIFTYDKILGCEDSFRIIKVIENGDRLNVDNVGNNKILKNDNKSYIDSIFSIVSFFEKKLNFIMDENIFDVYFVSNIEINYFVIFYGNRCTNCHNQRYQVKLFNLSTSQLIDIPGESYSNSLKQFCFGKNITYLSNFAISDTLHFYIVENDKLKKTGRFLIVKSDLFNFYNVVDFNNN